MARKQSIEELLAAIPPRLDNSNSLFHGKVPLCDQSFDKANRTFETKDGHILAIGTSGSGKSTCSIIPALQRWRDCVFCIDIKGELYKHTKDNRPNIKVFDPLCESTYGFNPYEMLDNARNPAQEAEAIAMAIIPTSPDTKEPFWEQSARNMLTGCILHYYKEGKTFIETMKAILSTPVAQLMDSIYATTKSEDAKRYLNPFVVLDDRPLASVYAELSRHIIVFATDEDIIHCLSRSENISPNDLENGKDIYLCIPEHLLAQWNGLLTLIVRQFLRHFEKRPDMEGAPILFMLDEFPRLGKIEGMAEAFATLRSKRITLYAVIQSLAQLDHAYGATTRRIIMDNCSFVAIFRVTDVES